VGKAGLATGHTGRLSVLVPVSSVQQPEIIFGKAREEKGVLSQVPKAGPGAPRQGAFIQGVTEGCAFGAPRRGARISWSGRGTMEGGRRSGPGTGWTVRPQNTAYEPGKTSGFRGLTRVWARAGISRGEIADRKRERGAGNRHSSLLT
jgi:hypothetical protein